MNSNLVATTIDVAETQRFVLLGASNLTIAFPQIVENLRAGFEEPLDIQAALGYGRSYGIWSRVLGRGLPGILQSRLWHELNDGVDRAGPLRALITDVGNDLVYGVPVPQIVDWLEKCFQQLSDQGAEIIVTLLPMGSVEKLSAWRYYVTKTMLFPGKGCSWPEMQRRVHELNERLQELCHRYQARMMAPPGEWYGFDPIHIRRYHRPSAWADILSLWNDFSPPESPRSAAWGTQLKFWSSRAAEHSLLGWKRTVSQPVIQTQRTRVSLF